jgi:hypothetical protein
MSGLTSKSLWLLFGLGLKTKVNDLVILVLKLLGRFLDLDMKIKWEEVCQFVPQNWWADEDGVSTRVGIRRLALVWSKSG